MPNKHPQSSTSNTSFPENLRCHTFTHVLAMHTTEKHHVVNAVQRDFYS